MRVVVSRDRIFNPTAVQRAGASGGTWTPVLVIAPLLLGLKSALPNLYIQPLIATLKLAHSLGVIGGRPGAAYWLVGCEEQGEHVTLLALDPHVTRVCSGAPINRTQHATFVSNGVARLKLTELDACLAVAFLCPTARDVDALAQSLALVRRPSTADTHMRRYIDRLFLARGHVSRPPAIGEFRSGQRPIRERVRGVRERQSRAR